MNIIRNEVKSPRPVISENISCFEGLRPAVIDIETTGLSADRCFIYLIGVLTGGADAASGIGTGTNAASGGGTGADTASGGADTASGGGTGAGAIGESGAGKGKASRSASKGKASRSASTGGASGTVVTQFLADSREEEAEMLEAFFRFIGDYDIYLNYNGTSFDIPFINKRCERLGLDLRLDGRRSVDYFRLFKASYVKNILPDLKLTTVEKLAGVYREDQFSGKDCIDLYRCYSEKGDRAAGRSVLLHNFEDLSCFPALNSLVEKIDLHKALMKTGFPVKSGPVLFFVNGIKAGEPDDDGCMSVRVKGEADGLEMDAEIYEETYCFKARAMSEEFRLEFTFETDGNSPTPGLIHREIMTILKEINC